MERGKRQESTEQEQDKARANARAPACHKAFCTCTHTTMGDTMRLRFRVLVSDEVQQAPRLSDLSAPPSPASCDGEAWKNTPLLSPWT
ncbi:hypothetical protein TRIATDRAFT_258816 [Trichoderma atroviride IMI 206040]|uniref:Uncharacterized protein n=1 Tax=Hypocrea atroviridis (strain ATCC 20476 / IMI 206040) TaxID=452589 RepID=G9P6V7_HYPAI|nr:uncharacterized protein TRIATDRAFT_258816 [Trichoderma atroviride IMI 206040]EHK40683.1 hypothetical protein TRIATDRAFT_258816 [Trichoderma atroviride IMI 206040]